MWIAFAIGWLLGSVSLYVWLVATAREPQRAECMECRLPECTHCPHLARAREAAMKRAA